MGGGIERQLYWAESGLGTRVLRAAQRKDQFMHVDSLQLTRWGGWGSREWVAGSGVGAVAIDGSWWRIYF